MAPCGTEALPQVASRSSRSSSPLSGLLTCDDALMETMMMDFENVACDGVLAGSSQQVRLSGLKSHGLRIKMSKHVGGRMDYT